MNVIDLLPDHPSAPQRLSFETFLPNLMRRAVMGILNREKPPARNVNDIGGSDSFQLTDKFLNSSVFGIYYQMNVVRHEHISD